MQRRFHIRFLIAIAALFGPASPALADVTAEYIGDDERERTIIEIADNGDLRVTDGTGELFGYLLVVGGKAYSVEPGPGGPLVTASEVEAHRFRRGLETGEIAILRDEDGDQPDFIRFVPGAAIEVAGYRGTEYVVEGRLYTPVGIADDPALAPLGQAYLRYERAVDEMSPGPGAVRDNLAELLGQRGVIRFWGRDLQSVSFEPIDPARFALPAAPLTLEQVLEEEAADPDLQDGDARERQAPIVQALFFEQALYTLARDGAVSRWADGAAEGAAVDAPGSVVSLCRMQDDLFIITGEGDEPDDLRLWSGRPGTWKLEGSFRQSEEDPFLALDCSGSEPLLLFAKAIWLPRSGGSIPIDPEKLAPGGYFTTLQHGGYLYVGSNAGEWGGGLRRFALTGGNGEAIDASDPQELCGGTLNMDCDPVTGLTVDPARAECVLASVGLVHFFAHGQVVRICDGQITPAYRKPNTLDPEWESNSTPEETFSSVPFFSMTSAGGASWAVGNDGLYRFGTDERPAFTPFERAKRWPASGVDWSDPRFVLVVTSMNQVHSLSGSSVILVPR